MSQDAEPLSGSLICGEVGNLGSNHTVTVLQGHDGVRHKNSGKKVSIARSFSKVRTSRTGSVMRPHLRTRHFRKPCNKNDAPAVKDGIWRKMCISSKTEAEGHVLLSLPKLGPVPAPSSKKPEEREFVVDSRVSMHMLSKEDFSSDELEPLLENPRTPQL